MQMVLAASAPQKIGAVVVGLLLVGWLAYIVAQIRRPGRRLAPGSEIELAPNRKPYYDDDGLEGPRLERVLGLAFLLLVVVAIGLPLYWLREPGRQHAAMRGFDNTAAHRGFLLFQPATSPLPTENVGHFGCADCHGSVGQGATGSMTITDPANPNIPARIVQWKAPALNTVLLRYTPDAVKTILTYGRAGTPMPAWGTAGGGAMNDQQLTDLIAYLTTIQLTPEQAKQDAAKYGNDGAGLFDAFCSRCHTEGWSYNEPGVVGGGAYGPNLTGGVEKRQFPDPAAQILFVTSGVTYGKQYGQRGIGTTCIAVFAGNPCATPGGGMPFFGSMLSADQIQAVVNYERSL